MGETIRNYECPTCGALITTIQRHVEPMTLRIGMRPEIKVGPTPVVTATCSHGHVFVDPTMVRHG